MSPGESESLLLGFETADDAAVYKMTEDIAALLTVDFFTPIVDDPYDFGRITAANALSDIYAMGGVPLTALNLLAFPCSMGADIVGDVLRGGADVVREAGAVIAGGHTIDDKEPKYGLSVFGTVHPEKIWRNQGAQAGDVIVLTKAIGTGILGTALKRGVATAEQESAAIASMVELNKNAASAASDLDVHACTDVTGFGLLGHLHEMAKASDVYATLERRSIPLLLGVHELAVTGCVPGRTTDVIKWASEFASYSSEGGESGEDGGCAQDLEIWWRILCDPQTSGGLLFALSPEDADVYVENLKNLNPKSAVSVIGAFGAHDGPAEHHQHSAGDILFS